MGKRNPFYGKHHTEESKRKMSDTLMGRPSTLGSFKKGHIPWNKGLKGVQVAWNKGQKGLQKSPKKGKTYEEFYGVEMAREIKRKLSGANTSHPAWNKGLTKETDDRVTSYAQALTGRQLSQETKEKLRLSALKRDLCGGKNPMSKPWVREKHQQVMRSKNYREKMSRIMKGKMTGEKNPMFGRTAETLKPETREKLRKAAIKANQKIGRQSISKPEKILKRKLEEMGISFVHQFPYKIGVADFFVPEARLIIECDGCHWHNYPEGTNQDIKQTQFLEEKGYKVLRFWDKEILHNLEGCVNHIEEALSWT